jgi:hypothetical protein
MTEQNDGAAQPQPTEPRPTQPVAPAVVEQPRTRLRDLTFRIRSLAAVAAAALLIGGGVGAAIGVAASGDGHPDGPGQTGFGRAPGGPMFNHAPNGQLPPGTAPQQQDGSQS